MSSNLTRRKPSGTAYHHGSHRHLLNTVDLVGISPSKLDAIVVPTARRPINMLPTINLAAELGCTLVALCSKWSTAGHVAKLAATAGVELIAADIEDAPADLVPEFYTTKLLAGTPFERRTDTSLKRNLGLLLTRLLGWQRIVFLDDDIEIPRPQDLNDAAQLLESYPTAAMHIDGFPDNSVVCHAYRITGGPQDSFVGGGALAVSSSSMTSFFPNIYNEDWFFLLDDIKFRPTAVTGSAKQRPYDPFAHEQRARSEEFGDCLAEGIFWLLDQKRRVKDADVDYWKFFLGNRVKFIRELIDRVKDLDTFADEKQRMLASLRAAQGRCQTIKPELCVQYLRAWRADCTRWRRHVIDLCDRHTVTPATVLSELGLGACGKYLAPRSIAA